MKIPDISNSPPGADVCVLVEGAYPFVAGGVSSWLHELLKAQDHLTFHLVALSADARPKQSRYELPPNVIGFTELTLQEGDLATPNGPALEAMIADLERPLTQLLSGGGLAEFKSVLDALQKHRPVASRSALMNSEAAFEMIKRMYRRVAPGTSFINYFWSWRALAGGLYSTLLASLPKAGLYHAISTGYAGLALARAVLETGRPGLLTEHGIYTNERRIEITMADWLTESLPPSYGIENRRRDLRDVWTQAFQAYSRVCYEACDKITTLYTGNQVLQLRDGASPDRLMIISNGIDYDAFSSIQHSADPRPPTVALIGRVVPIKDVKTYIRAAAHLRTIVPDVRALLVGPTEEDPEYFRECQELVSDVGLEDAFEFTGRVNLKDYMGRIDVVVLTSISEAQPLVLLEAGAAGIPSVSTDVGSCRDILYGRPDEDPPLGPGGLVTPLANPIATAEAVARILQDRTLYRQYSSAIQNRARKYYNKQTVDQMYCRLYEEHLALPDRQSAGEVAL